MTRILGIILWLLLGSSAQAGVNCSLPFTLTNGTIADASQVMANYNALVTCLTNAAAAGSNNDITSLSALTTPINPAQGGTTTFIGSSVSGTNAVTVGATAPSGFALVTGYSVFFVPVANNTGAVTLNVNGTGALPVNKLTPAGGTAGLGSGDLQSGTVAYVVANPGGVYQLMNPANLLQTNVTNQSISGGAIISSNNLGTFSGGGTLTVSCGLSPLQFFTDNGAMTIAAPVFDSSCALLMTNGASASLPSFSGFTVNSNTGENLDTTNGHQFFINFIRVNGVSTFWVKALQ